MGPAGHSPASARATATNMLHFLDKLRERASTENVTEAAANIVVMQFKRDLMENGTVASLRRLNGHIQDGSVVNTVSGVARAIELVGHRCACAKALTTPAN